VRLQRTFLGHSLDLSDDDATVVACRERLIEAAAAIAAAVDQVLGNAATRTRDIGGVAGTQVFGAAVCGVLRKE